MLWNVFGVPMKHPRVLIKEALAQHVCISYTASLDVGAALRWLALQLCAFQRFSHPQFERTVSMDSLVQLTPNPDDSDKV